jgi:hypothetical protein
MAAAALTPRVRMMAICDRVWESKSEAGVFNLKGVRQGLTANAFPFVPRRLSLFLVLSCRRPGEFPCYVCVVNERTNREIFYSHVEPRPAFASDQEFFAWCGRIRCRFREEGAYTVQVWFFQEEGNDVLKGEVPFYITTE